MCILHMPKEPAEVSDEARAIAAEFEDAWGKEFEACIAETSTREIEIHGIYFPTLRLNAREFDRPVVFSGITVASHTNITACQFASGLHFEDCTLNGLYCHDSFFAVRPGEAFARQRQVDYVENTGFRLEGVRIRGNLFFSSVHFGEIPLFNARLERRTMFRKCFFYDYVWFVIDCAGDAVFHDSQFAGPAMFDLSRFSASLTLNGGDDLMFHDSVAFRALQLGPESKLSFIHVNLSQASFIDTRIEDFDFRRVRWHRPRGRFFRWSRTRAAIIDEFSPTPLVAPEQIAEVYRQLVLNHEKKRDYTAAEDFHIGEMEMLRRSQRWPLNGYAIYHALSRYGTSYGQALAVLMLIVVLFAGAFLFTGFRAGTHTIAYDLAFAPPFADAADVLRDAGDALLFTLSIAAFNRERFYEPLGWQTRALTYLAAIMLASQAALVLLAIRRRFKR